MTKQDKELLAAILMVISDYLKAGKTEEAITLLET